MSTQIPAIPQGVTGDNLVTHLNDRLRRISEALGPGATGATGAAGAPGAAGGGSTLIAASRRSVPLGPNPLTQSLNDFAGNHVSVKMRGAIGDGITDDTFAFQTAIADAAAFGLQVLVPAGTYKVSGLTITQPVQIVGEGQNQSIIQYSGSAAIDSVVTIDGSANTPYPYVAAVRLENLQLSGNANATHALKLINCDRSVFRNIAARNCTGAAIFCHFVVACEFDNIAVSNEFGIGFTTNPQYGLWAEYIFTANVLSNIRVDGATQDGIHLGDGTGNVSFNVFTGGLLEANNNGIFCDVDASDNEFISYDVEGNAAASIDIAGFRNVFTNLLSGDGGAATAGAWLYLRGGDNLIIGGQIGKYEVFSGATGNVFCGVSHQFPSAVYSATVTYGLGEIIEYGGFFWYQSLSAGNIGNTPSSSPLSWSPNPPMAIDNGTGTQFLWCKNITTGRSPDVNQIGATGFVGNVTISLPGGGTYTSLRVNSPAWGALLLLYSGLTGNYQNLQYGCAAGTQGLLIQELVSGTDPTVNLPSAVTVLQIIGQLIGLGAGVAAPLATVHVQDAAARPTQLLIEPTAAQSTTPLLYLYNGASLFSVDINGNVAAAGKFAANGAAPQAAAASGGAVVTTAPALASYGYTAAQAAAIITLLNNIRAALVANGIMS